jgi:hypothetical protein
MCEADQHSHNPPVVGSIPPAPPFEISFWPAFILSYLNAYIEHIALPPDAIADEIIRCSGSQVALLPQLPRQGGPQECRKAADLATLRDSGAPHLAVAHLMLGGSEPVWVGGRALGLEYGFQLDRRRGAADVLQLLRASSEPLRLRPRLT